MTPLVFFVVIALLSLFTSRFGRESPNAFASQEDFASEAHAVDVVENARLPRRRPPVVAEAVREPGEAESVIRVGHALGRSSLCRRADVGQRGRRFRLLRTPGARFML